VPLKPPQTLSEIRVKEEQLSLQVLHSPPGTPVKADRLEYFLQGYDVALTHYLTDGFRFGFRVHVVGERLVYESPNLKSALEQPELVKAKLGKEYDAGRIVGPFTTLPFPNFRRSPLGITLNDFIPDFYSTVKYASVSDASKSMKGKVVLWPKQMLSPLFA